MKMFRKLALAASFGLVGCATAQPLPDHPGAIGAIQSYYNSNAWEEGARCVLPRMDVTQTKVIEDTPERLVVEVRYYWQDETRESDTFGNVCNGFATRTFTLAEGRVIKMTGEQR